MRFIPIAGALLVLTACGPDVVERVELDEVCGKPSPVRVLELDEGVQPLGVPGAVRRIGERILWVVGRNEFVPSRHEHGYEPPLRTTVWATGPCGESPMVVAEDMTIIFERDVWPGEALACSFATGDIFVLDPHGEREPRLLFAGVGCHPDWTAYGLVAVVPHGEATSALVLHPYPASPWDAMPPPVALIDPIRAELFRNALGGYGDTFDVLEHEILALTPMGELVRVSLPDGAVTLVQRDVKSFRSSHDGRFVLWQDVAPVGDDPEFPTGAVSLLDRTTGTSQWIADAAINEGLALVDDGPPLHARVQLGRYVGDPTRFVMLDSGATVDVPADRFVNGPVGDGTRWLTIAWDEHFFVDPRYVLRTLETGAEVVLHEGEAHTFSDTDAIEFLDASLWIDLAPFDQGPLTRVPLDTLQPELLAERMSMHRRDLDDGRIVTALDVHGHFIGDLVLVDPATLGEALVDTEVFAFSTRYDEDDTFEGAIPYAVSDGDRSGVWLARLAAP